MHGWRPTPRRFLRRRFIVKILFYLLILGHLNSIVSASATPSASSFRWRRDLRGPLVESPDFSFYFNGFIQGDLLSLEGASPELESNPNWRDGRVSMTLNFYQHWQIDTTYDFRDSQLLDAYFAYVGSHATVMAGQIFVVFGISNTSDTSQITFLELPLPVFPFSTQYYPGVQVGFYQSPFTIYTSFFGPQWGTPVYGRSPYGGTISATFSPIHTDTRLFVLSLSGWQQGMDSSHTFSLSPIPEVDTVNEGTFIDTGDIGNVKNFQSFDGGAAGVYGPFSMQSEYINTWINRTDSFPVLKVHGFYVTTSYFLTGESRLYNFQNAGFVGITPIRRKYGAWQIALRYSELNLMTGNIAGGRERDITVGLNWFPIQEITCKFNYVRARMNPNSSGENQVANMYVLRLQIIF